ncbi:MAG: YceD family protein [Tissierella sp.]|uniref:YceD family protein n=1 Tax=Tissierella sp. TaxID=41274 RepID=UPI003F98FC43
MSINLSNLFSTDENIYYFEDEIINSDVNIDLKDFEILHPIKYKGQISKINREYIIDLQIYYTFKTNCDRCLSSTIKNVESSLYGKLENYKKIQDEDEEDDVIYYDNDVLDIEKYVLMEVLSSLPMKTLCKETCKGLCPICGTDLNEESCDCVVENIDPRLEKLKDFFDKN